jgi:hypothetical protein
MSARKASCATLLNRLTTLAMGVLLLAMVYSQPQPTSHIQVVEWTVSPGVTYRCERRWRLNQQAIEQQVEWWLDQKQESSRNSALAAPSRSSWSIAHSIQMANDTAASEWQSIRTPVERWFQRRNLSSALRIVPSNWVLTDVGISRNGKPLPLPAEIAKALEKHLVLKDRCNRAWPEFVHPPDPTVAWMINDAPPLVDELDKLIRLARELDADIKSYEPIAVVVVEGTECIFAYPYLLFIRDGRLTGALGGDGRFDYLPPLLMDQ